MSIERLRSGIFRKFFLIYVIIFVALILASFSLIFLVISNERAIKAVNNCDEYAKRVTALVDNQINNVHIIRDNIRNTTWVSKLMSETNVFASEFDIIRQMEISTEIRSFSAISPIIGEVSIIYPYKDLVVTSKGWFDIQGYNKYLKTNYGIDDQLVNLKVCKPEKGYGVFYSSEFTYNDSHYMAIAQQMEMVPKPRAISLVIVNKYNLSEYLIQMLNDNLKGIELVDSNNKVLIKCGTMDTIGNYTTTTASKSLFLTVNTSYDIANMTINLTNIATIVMFALLALFLTLVISYILASVCYSPINNLLARIFSYHEDGLKSVKEEYKFIGDSFEILHEENTSMHKNVELYRGAARNNVFMQLLKGYFFTDDAMITLEKYGIYYTNDDWFSVMLINLDNVIDMESAESLGEQRLKFIIKVESILKEIGYNTKVIDVLEKDIAIILSFEKICPNEELIYHIAATTNENIYNLTGIAVNSSLSKPHKGIIGISTAYQEARYSNDSTQHRQDALGILFANHDINMYYYPTDWEYQLINNLKTGDISTVRFILKEIQNENLERKLSSELILRLIRLLMETILRVGYELTIDCQFLLGTIETKYKNSRVDDLWKLVYDTADIICNKVMAANLKMLTDINNEILNYVNENYSDLDMSLKTISSRFNISIVSVSRVFKEIAKINFHEYVTRLRMEKAKELLRNSGYDIQKISKAVGYDSEYSFRRAFFRSEGIKPKDYVGTCFN